MKKSTAIGMLKRPSEEMLFQITLVDGMPTVVINQRVHTGEDFLTDIKFTIFNMHFEISILRSRIHRNRQVTGLK